MQTHMRNVKRPVKHWNWCYKVTCAFNSLSQKEGHDPVCLYSMGCLSVHKINASFIQCQVQTTLHFVPAKPMRYHKKKVKYFIFCWGSKKVLSWGKPHSFRKALSKVINWEVTSLGEASQSRLSWRASAFRVWQKLLAGVEGMKKAVGSEGVWRRGSSALPLKSASSSQQLLYFCVLSNWAVHILLCIPLTRKEEKTHRWSSGLWKGSTLFTWHGLPVVFSAEPSLVSLYFQIIRKWTSKAKAQHQEPQWWWEQDEKEKCGNIFIMTKFITHTLMLSLDIIFKPTITSVTLVYQSKTNHHFVVAQEKQTHTSRHSKYCQWWSNKLPPHRAGLLTRPLESHGAFLETYPEWMELLPLEVAPKGGWELARLCFTNVHWGPAIHSSRKSFVLEKSVALLLVCCSRQWSGLKSTGCQASLCWGMYYAQSVAHSYRAGDHCMSLSGKSMDPVTYLINSHISFFGGGGQHLGECFGKTNLW